MITIADSTEYLNIDFGLSYIDDINRMITIGNSTDFIKSDLGLCFIDDIGIPDDNIISDPIKRLLL